MTSINTNSAAITALRTLQQTATSLEKTENRISTGLKIGEAKDNAAYWSISTTLKSDNKALGTVRDALGLGASTVDVAYQGLNKAKDVLDEIKSKLTAATQDGVNRDTIQQEIKQLQDQLTSIASSSTISGENWLSVDTSVGGYNAQKQVVASFARDAHGAVSIGTINVDTTNVSLLDASTVANTGGILDKSQSLVGKDGRNLTIGGTTTATLGNTATGGLSNTAGVVTGALGTGTATPTSGVAATASATAVGNVSSGQLDLGTVTLSGVTSTTDTLNFSFKLNGIDRQISFAKGVASTSANLATAINTALTTAGLNTAIVASDNSGALRLDLQGATAGDTLQLTDLTVKDASGRAYNPATVVLGTGASFVAATAGTYLSDTLVWTSVANKTAQVSLKIDGVDTTVEVATGATIAGFVANLNANSNFSTKAVASGTTTLTVASATTGAASTVTLNSIVFKNADGTVFTPATSTAFDKVGSAAKVTTVSFGPLALDADDNIKFDIAVNDDTGVKTVTIDKALIDKTLGATANGRISVVADYKKVFDAALTAAGITSLKTTVNSTALDIETTTTGGTNAKITITKAGASNGGAQISVSEIDISTAAFSGFTSAQVKDVLSAYIAIVNTAINKVTSAAASLGSVSSRIDLQKSFVDSLMDTIDKGVGNLIDADISEESTKLQALQVKQQLGVQSLSIANQSSQQILRLFQQ